MFERPGIDLVILERVLKNKVLQHMLQNFPTFLEPVDLLTVSFEFEMKRVANFHLVVIHLTKDNMEMNRKHAFLFSFYGAEILYNSGTINDKKHRMNIDDAEKKVVAAFKYFHDEMISND